METLKEIREKLGLTQVEIATIVGIKHPTWNVYENGKKKLPIRIIKLLKKTYNVDYINPEPSYDLENDIKRTLKESSDEINDNKYVELLEQSYLNALADKEIYKRIVQLGLDDKLITFDLKKLIPNEKEKK